MAIVRMCNMCGKKFDKCDEANDVGIHMSFGYGSKHDKDVIDADLCCECGDKMWDYLKKECVINPIIERF